MAFRVALLGRLWSQTIPCLGVFGGGAESSEDGDVFDHVGRLFVEEALFFLSQANAFAVEILELVDFIDGRDWTMDLDRTLERVHGKPQVFAWIAHQWGNMSHLS